MSDKHVKKIGYILSGNGSVAECCMKFVDEYKIAVNSFVFSDRKCPALEKAEKYGIKCRIIDEDWKLNREKACDKILEMCKEMKIDFLFLNFNRLLTGELLKFYDNRIINLHFSLLPAYKGFSAIENAIAEGCRYIGATTHFIDETMDGGKIILQGVVPVDSKMSLSEMRERHYKMLKRISLESLLLMSQDRIELFGGNVVLKDCKYDSYPINPLSGDARIEKFLNEYDK